VVLGYDKSNMSSSRLAFMANKRQMFVTASQVPGCEDLAKTTKVTQLTTNGKKNHVHNVVPSFIIIKWMGFQRHT